MFFQLFPIQLYSSSVKKYLKFEYNTKMLLHIILRYRRLLQTQQTQFVHRNGNKVEIKKLENRGGVKNDNHPMIHAQKQWKYFSSQIFETRELRATST